MFFMALQYALITGYSGLFRDILSLPALNPEPIEFPARRFILSAFLTMVYQYPAPLPPNHLNSQDLTLLLDLAQRYDSPNIVTAVLKAFEKATMTRPWRIFVLASERNDLGLAKLALRQLRVEDKGRLAECEVGDWDLVKVGQLTGMMT
jgi:hypothetical protein